jgi:hypothetical protein
MRMMEEAGPMLKVSMGQSLKSVEVERKGLTLRIVDKMEQVVGLVKDLGEEAVQASRETVRSGKELGMKVESVLEGIMEERGVHRMEREKEREREREKERERGKEVERAWFQTGQLSREKQKERETKESSTTTTTATKAWETRSGLSLFGIVAEKKQREDGVVFMQVCQWKVNNPGVFQVDRF